MSSLFLQDARRLLQLAMPVMLGQLATMGFGVIDTVMLARDSATGLATLAIGHSVFISVYVGLTGVMQALTPIAGHHYGAGRHAEIGEDLRQALWVAVVAALLGIAMLLNPQPLLRLAGVPAELHGSTADYLAMLAWGLPAALVFRGYAALSNGVSLPLMVTALQLTGLALKWPLNALLIYGNSWIPPMGSTGCALATVIIYWTWVALALAILRWHRAYRPFAIMSQFSRPRWQRIRTLLRLGIPVGLSYMIEVTAFSAMALLISRLGPSALAGHQIASNLAALLYMLPLSLAIGISTLVSQALGARQPEAARRITWHGVRFAALLAGTVGLLLAMGREQVVRLYTPDPVIIAAALPLLVFIILYQIADALQVATAFALRAYRIAVLPMVVYAVALWGLGIGGGYVLGLNLPGNVPEQLRGAAGFWFANGVSLLLAALALLLILRRVSSIPPGMRQP